MRNRGQRTQPPSGGERAPDSFLRRINSLLIRINSFRDAQGNLIPELLDTEAKKLGEAFEERRGSEKVSSAQLRRFYSDVKALQNEIKSGLEKEGKTINSDKPEDLQKYLALVKMQKAKVAYGTRRLGPTISQGFKETIDRCIDLINTPRDFNDFALFFECVVGYYYGAGGGR